VWPPRAIHVLEEPDSGRHGARQVRGGLQALAVDQLPLQVPDDHVGRRRGDVVAREGVAAHGQIMASAATQRPYSSARGRTLYRLRPRLTALRGRIGNALTGGSGTEILFWRPRMDGYLFAAVP
jgi:hypothetical protein